MYHSQNNEAEVVINYFAGRTGRLLSFGEFDGKYLSNSYDLIQRGWGADLFEPIEGNYDKIVELHKNIRNVKAHNFGIANESGIQKMYVAGGSVVAVLDEMLLKEWGYPLQYETNASFLTVKDAMKLLHPPYAFITIDCEGLDWDILQQMDLAALSCECICIEQGNDPVNYARMKEYCARFGLTRELLYNFENVILAK